MRSEAMQKWNTLTECNPFEVARIYMCGCMLIPMRWLFLRVKENASLTFLVCWVSWYRSTNLRSSMFIVPSLCVFRLKSVRFSTKFNDFSDLYSTASTIIMATTTKTATTTTTIITKIREWINIFSQHSSNNLSIRAFAGALAAIYSRLFLQIYTILWLYIVAK